MTIQEYNRILEEAQDYKNSIESRIADMSYEFYKEVEKTKAAFEELSEEEQEQVNGWEELTDKPFWEELYNGI